MSYQNQVTAAGFQPLHEHVFVTDLDSGMHVSKGGIIMTDDDMKEWGIRPRWGRVWAVGPEVKDIAPGEWIFIEHARWTNAINIKLPSGTVKVWRVEYPKAVMLATKNDPRETLWEANVTKLKR